MAKKNLSKWDIEALKLKKQQHVTAFRKRMFRDQLTTMSRQLEKLCDLLRPTKSGKDGREEPFVRLSRSNHHTLQAKMESAHYQLRSVLSTL